LTAKLTYSHPLACSDVRVSDTDYLCTPLESEDESAVKAFRKAVILSTRALDRYHRLDAVEVAVKYGSGPERHFDFPDGYHIHVEAADGSVMISYTHGHPALGSMEPPASGVSVVSRPVAQRAQRVAGTPHSKPTPRPTAKALSRVNASETTSTRPR
jgi:hypothetical protein